MRLSTFSTAQSCLFHAAALSPLVRVQTALPGSAFGQRAKVELCRDLPSTPGGRCLHRRHGRCSIEESHARTDPASRLPQPLGKAPLQAQCRTGGDASLPGLGLMGGFNCRSTPQAWRSSGRALLAPGQRVP